MNKTARIGILIVLLLVAGGIYFFKYAAPASDSITYFGYYDNVQGLSKGAPVRIKGVAIGKVTAIDLLDDQRIRISMTLTDNNRLTEGSTAVLVTSSIIADKSIDILSGTKGNYLPHGAVMPTAVDPNIVDDFAASITPAIEQTKFLLRATDTGLNDVRHMLTSGLTAHFMHMLVRLDKQTTDFSRIANDINQQSQEFTQALRDAGRTVEELSATPDSIFQNTAARSEALVRSDIRKNTEALQSSISDLRQNIQTLRQSAWIQDDGQAADRTSSLDSLIHDMESLQADPPGISIFGKKK